MKYQKDLNRAYAQKKNFKKVIKDLSKSPKKEFDQMINQAHEKVFSEMNCLECANCCKTTSPIIKETDIKRISKFLNLSSNQFKDQYLLKDEDSDWVFNRTPCVFLNESDNSCSIYHVRPEACQDYPHTARKNMHKILDLTLRNAEICPAVSRMISSFSKF